MSVTIAVLLAIGLVVFVVKGDHIRQREAIVGSDEVDGLQRPVKAGGRPE